MAQHRGTVAWFNNGKGYGFLRYEDGTDVFVHHTGINAEGYRVLKEGDTVDFDVVPGPEGKPQATNVTVSMR